MDKLVMCRLERVTDLIEDVEWMLHGGESLRGAVARQARISGAIGKSVSSMERALADAGRGDLLKRLRANEPRAPRRAA